MELQNNLLYNKYRPKSLQEIIGHEKIKKELLLRSKQNTIPRVILLSGLTGVGKTTLARIISKNILCQHKDEHGNSCNNCEICKTIDNEKLNNFYFEENASNLTIDKVRDLVEQIEVKTLSKAHAKVFVIDEIQEMKKTQAALNNMLKPIEKEYKDVYFIFGTMSESDVPQAIKNRCVLYRLQPLSIEDISTHLYSICQKENIVIDTEEKANVLLAIAENSNGSMRQALSLLERVIYSELWTLEDIQKELSLTTIASLSQLISRLLKGDATVIDDITKEMLDQIRYIFITLYKATIIKELSYFEKTQIQNVIIPKEFLSNTIQFQNVLQNILQILYGLFTYNYITKDLIIFTFLKIISYITEIKNITNNKTLQRREIKK